MDYTCSIPVSIKSILESKQRSSESLEELLNYVSSLAGFSVLASKLSKSRQLQLVNELELEEHPSSKTLFKKGDPSDKFYLILQGKIDLFDHYPDGSKHFVSVCTTGKSLGDRGLIRNEPRSLTAKISDHSYLASLHAIKFRQIVRKTVYKYFEQKLKFIEKNIPLINKYSLFYKEKIAYALEFVAFARNEVILEEGSYSKFIFFIINGECLMVSKGKHNVMFLGIGSAIGDESVLLDKPSFFTIKAVSDNVSAFKIKAEDFLQLIPEDSIAKHKHIAQLRENERVYLNKCKSATDCRMKNNSNRRKVKVASSVAVKSINKLIRRKSTVKIQNNALKVQLEKLRDITLRRYYKYNPTVKITSKLYHYKSQSTPNTCQIIGN